MYTESEIRSKINWMH